MIADEQGWVLLCRRWDRAIWNLPDAALAAPRLLSTCPHCAQPLKFNPFFVDKPNVSQ